MNILLTVVSSLLAATGIAYLEFRYKMRPARLDVYDTIRNGRWTTNRRGEGSREALRIHRARIARYTGFGMNRKEAIYWGTSVDSNGEPLNCTSTYRIDGVDPETRWWCMTVYQDQFFIPNPFDRYSFSKTDVQRSSDDSWIIRISGEEQPGSWIPLGNATGSFHLTFRCYGPGDSMIEDSEAAQLPVIIKEGAP